MQQALRKLSGEAIRLKLSPVPEKDKSYKNSPKTQNNLSALGQLLRDQPAGKAARRVGPQYKGLGEAYLILRVLDELKKYDYCFKLSGRYYLTEAFDVTDFQFSAFNFKNYTRKKTKTGESDYIKGSHSTRLYGVPGDRMEQYETALKKSIKELEKGTGIEYALPRYLKKEKFYYCNMLGVAGMCRSDSGLSCASLSLRDAQMK